MIAALLSLSPKPVGWVSKRPNPSATITRSDASGDSFGVRMEGGAFVITLEDGGYLALE